MAEISSILEDPREIRGLTNEAQGENFAWVGQDGVTRIVAYGEDGHMARVPYFAVYRNGDQPCSRISAGQVAVYYFEDSADLPLGGVP